jgi:uncharacterized protein YabN with tetrapyrrole methylase and pyrophosphatase domain
LREFINVFEKADDKIRKKALEDILLGVSALAYRSGLDAESALREALGRFRARFSMMESFALQNGEVLMDMSEERKEELWRKAGDEIGEDK